MRVKVREADAEREQERVGHGIMWVFQDLGVMREDFLATLSCHHEEAYVGQVEGVVGHVVVA
jgi:hypothetical protein